MLFMDSKDSVFRCTLYCTGRQKAGKQLKHEQTIMNKYQKTFSLWHNLFLSFLVIHLLSYVQNEKAKYCSALNRFMFDFPPNTVNNSK